MAVIWLIVLLATMVSCQVPIEDTLDYHELQLYKRRLDELKLLK